MHSSSRACAALTILLATTASLRGQHATDPIPKDGPPPTNHPIDIGFSVDARRVRLTVDGANVRLEGAGLRIDRPAVALDRNPAAGDAGGPIAQTVRIVDADGTAVAVITLEPLGLGIEFVPRQRPAWLGVDVQPVPAALVAQLGLDPTRTSLIAAVRPDSPASAAGLAENDVLLGIGTDGPADPTALGQRLATSAPGDRIALRVLRRGAALEVAAELGPEPTDVVTRFGVPLLADLPILDVLFQNNTASTLDPALRAQLRPDLYRANDQLYLLDRTAPPASSSESIEARLTRIETLLERLEAQRPRKD